MLAGLNFQFLHCFLGYNSDFQGLLIPCADFHFTTSSRRHSAVTSWPEKTLSHALFLCPLIVTQSSVLPIWCIIFSFSLYSFPILLSSFSIYFIKLLLWLNSHQQWRILCEAEGELILFSPHTCGPAKAGGFTACHPDCLEDVLCPHLSHSFRCSPGARACKLISENVKGLSSLIKCKICLTASEDLRLLHLFFKRGWFELQSKIALVWERGRWWPQAGHPLLRESQTGSLVNGA